LYPFSRGKKNLFNSQFYQANSTFYFTSLNEITFEFINIGDESQRDLLSSRWVPVNRISSDGVKGYLKTEDGKAEMMNDSMPFDRRLKKLYNKINS